MSRDFKSGKLAYAASMSTALSQKKRLEQIGLVLIDTHAQGVQYGQSFEKLNDMPAVKDGAAVSAGTIFAQYDMPMMVLPGTWTRMRGSACARRRRGRPRSRRQ